MSSVTVIGVRLDSVVGTAAGCKCVHSTALHGKRCCLGAMVPCLSGGCYGWGRCITYLCAWYGHCWCHCWSCVRLGVPLDSQTYPMRH